jgi:hypothetical protein
MNVPQRNISFPLFEDTPLLTSGKNVTRPVQTRYSDMHSRAIGPKAFMWKIMFSFHKGEDNTIKVLLTLGLGGR